MKKSFAVLGLGRFGSSVAEELFEKGQEVLAVDKHAVNVENIKDKVTVAVQADMRDERALSQLEIQRFDVVLITIGSDAQTSILATVLCKELGAKYVIAKAADPLHAKLLSKVGADKVVMTEREAGARLAHSLVSESVIDYLELSEEYSVSELNIPPRWVGHSLDGLKVRNTYDISVMAIRRDGEIIIRIDPYAPLQSGDVLVVIGGNDDIQKIATLR